MFGTWVFILVKYYLTKYLMLVLTNSLIRIKGHKVLARLGIPSHKKLKWAESNGMMYLLPPQSSKINICKRKHYQTPFRSWGPSVSHKNDLPHSTRQSRRFIPVLKPNPAFLYSPHMILLMGRVQSASIHSSHF